MLLYGAGRANVLDGRENLSHTWVNSVPQGWFHQLPTDLSVKLCVCHREGLSRLAGSRRRTAGRELTAIQLAKEKG